MAEKNSRRQVLKGLAIGAAATAVPVGTAVAATGPDHFSRAGEVWSLVAPFRKGSHLGFGWFLGDVRFDKGAAVLRFLNEEGREVHAALCYHQGAPKGLAHTDYLDLVLMDGGQGDKRTDEELGRVLLRLARVVQGNEQAVLNDRSLAGKLLTHAERIDRYGPEAI